MKKIFILMFISLSFFLTISATQASAKVLTNKNGDVNIAENEIVDDDVFIGAQSVTIDGIVNGDAFIGAGTVKITGTINGNLHLGTGNFYLNGYVKGNVYAGAQSVMINNSTIEGTLLVGAATVDIDKQSSIDGSIIAGAGSLIINSFVSRNVFAGVKNLRIGDDAEIGKSLYYAVSDKEQTVNISETAQIRDGIFKTETKTPKEKISVGKQKILAFFAWFEIITSIVSLIAALIIGYVYMKFFKNNFDTITELIQKQFWKCFGIGFLITVAFIPGLIFLAISIIGIPIAGLVSLLFLLYSYLAKIVVGYGLGVWLSGKLKWRLSTYGIFALGLLTIFILKLIPIIGFITGLIVLSTGLGVYNIYFFSKK